MRTKMIVPIAVLAGLPLAALLFWYLGRPALVKAYYIRLFADAQTITISRPAMRKSVAPAVSKTIRRRDHPETFARIEEAVRNGFVLPAQTQDIPRWELEVVDGRGHATRIDLRYCLVSQSQPYLHSLWFYPVLPDWGGDPGIFPEIDPLMDAKVAPPTPAPR